MRRGGLRAEIPPNMKWYVRQYICSPGGGGGGGWGGVFSLNTLLIGSSRGANADGARAGGGFASGCEGCPFYVDSGTAVSINRPSRRTSASFLALRGESRDGELAKL